MRRVLAERRFPVRSIKFLASAKSAGKTVEFNGKQYPVEAIRPRSLCDFLDLFTNTEKGNHHA